MFIELAFVFHPYLGTVDQNSRNSPRYPGWLGSCGVLQWNCIIRAICICFQQSCSSSCKQSTSAMLILTTRYNRSTHALAASLHSYVPRVQTVWIQSFISHIARKIAEKITVQNSNSQEVAQIKFRTRIWQSSNCCCSYRFKNPFSKKRKVRQTGRQQKADAAPHTLQGSRSQDSYHTKLVWSSLPQKKKLAEQLVSPPQNRQVMKVVACQLRMGLISLWSLVQSCQNTRHWKL